VKPMIISLLVVAVLSAAQGKQTFIGIVTDDMCPMGDHSRMRMGATDAECAKACIAAHAASYVLYDGKNVYILSDQKTPEPFAGQRARVVGTLDAKTMTIRVESVTAAD
jgi:hypothetical protein